MIEVKELCKNYGSQKAIDQVTFSIKKGEVVGFLGPNGAGKSTTMRIIAGSMAPTSGVALIGGIDVFEEPIRVKQLIGYLPETPPVYSELRVSEYLQYVSDLKKVPQALKKSYIDAAIEKTQLQEVSHKLIQNLSKGFRQRVGIAQALVANPQVLILDEPTVGLDPKQVAEIRNLIKDLRGEHTVILSTHILPEVQASCDRVIIINRGRIMAEDSLANLSERAQTSTGFRTVSVKVKQFSNDTLLAFKDLPGVVKVVSDENEKKYDIELDQEDDRIDQLAAFIGNKRLGLIEIVPGKNLEDVFIQLTYGSKV